MARPKMPLPLVTVQTIGTVRPLGPPVRELWALYLDHCEARARCEALSHSRVNQLRRTAELSEALPSHPEQGHVRKWLDNMAGASGTIKLQRDNLHALYAWAVANNYAAYNPVYGLKFRVGKPHRHAIRDIAQKWPALVEAAAPRDAREAAFLGVMRFTGLREGEALGLFPEDIDTRGAVWRLSIRRQRTMHSLETTERLKSAASRGTVDVHPTLAAMLAPVLAEGAAQARVGRGGGQLVLTPLLFPYRANDLARWMAAFRSVAASDFPPNDAWHVFRHTLAVELYLWGRDVLTISRQLRHESIEYTQTYLRDLMGSEAPTGVFAGMDQPPPFVIPPTAPGANTPAPLAPFAPRQTAFGLGPLGPVKQQPTARGGAPPGEEKSRSRTRKRSTPAAK